MFRPGPVTNVKFQSDWTKYTEVHATFCVLAKHQHSPHRHCDIVWRNIMIFTIWHYQYLKAFLTRFELHMVNVLGTAPQSLKHVISCCQYREL